MSSVFVIWLSYNEEKESGPIFEKKKSEMNVEKVEDSS